jgi:ParB-like chromosome segregation protein Spo0J
MRLKLSEIKTGSHPKQWAIFERQKLIHKHIAEHGMVNPIVVNSKSELMFGGCRLQYAALNDWEDIEVIVCDDLEEVTRLQDAHSLFEYSFLNEKYIERKKEKETWQLQTHGQ